MRSVPPRILQQLVVDERETIRASGEGIALGVRKVYEAEQDGCSVIIWEAAKGIRVVYPTDQSAETAAAWLIKQANRFHEAKESNNGTQDSNMVSVVCYGDQPMTEFAFVRNYLNRVKKLGYEVHDGLTRETSEFW